MSLKLPQNFLDQIKSHCQEAYPHECCGALIGSISGDDKTVSSVERLTNSEPEHPQRMFVINPTDLNNIQLRLRNSGQDIIGFYHSHPDSPAKPSSTDLEWAWPVYSYVIVRVDNGVVAEIFSYVLDDSGDNFENEDLDQ
jgi:proteasome lid subunit RPN8/RPN11